MEREFVEEYKGVRIHVWKQTHSDTGSEFLGHGHHVVKNPKWKPPTLLNRPIFHVVSHELSTIEAKSYLQYKAVLAYKAHIDQIQANANYKKKLGYALELFTCSEKFMLTIPS